MIPDLGLSILGIFALVGVVLFALVLIRTRNDDDVDLWGGL